jgi:hypothetical protein
MPTSSFITGERPVSRARTAVALDAALVRLVLVPALMRLLGPWNWWLPAGLTNLLPTSRLERRLLRQTTYRSTNTVERA